MKAGDVLLFSHDMVHCSRNESEHIRRTVMYTYCPGVIANSFGGDTLYDRIFEEASEGSWLKYFTRQPHGFREIWPCGVPVEKRNCMRRSVTTRPNELVRSRSVQRFSHAPYAYR